jgi:chemotaxis protein methyltransferase CheR
LARSTFFDGVTMKAEEFRLLRDLLATRTGLSFGPDARPSVERRLRERLSVLGISTFTEYYQYLRFNPRAGSEWEEAVELLTTNETYFFREDYQLRAFSQEVLPLLAEQTRARKRLALWSAGCSTGEEAYTLAMLVLQSGLFEGWDIKVLGSDISKRCITTARRGVYGTASFRATPPEAKRAYFLERPDGYHVVDRVRSLCHFGSMNLLDEDRARLLGRLDAIFCRNVLIYFDAHARRRTIDMFHDRLYQGGVLFLGHSESLLNVTTAFELLHLREDLVYRKPVASSPDEGSAEGGVLPRKAGQ